MKLKKIFASKRNILPLINPRCKEMIDRSAFIIHHYCPHTYNIGDHFVIKSIRTYLRQFLPEAVFIPKASAGNRGWGMPVRLQGTNVNLSNEFADAVIVGGSDQYNNWDLRIRKEEVVKLIPPLYLIGMGASSKKINQKPFIESSKLNDDIRMTHEKARMVSVRDQYTYNFLNGLSYSKAVVTGCPALHLFNEEFHLAKNGHAALTFPFPVIKKRNQELYKNLIEKIQSLVRLLKAKKQTAYIVCHDDRDVFTAQKYFPQEKIFYSNYVDEFIDFYKRSSLVIGSRLHASIFTAGLGKPFVNINIDFRGQAFSDMFEMNQWNLNIDDPEFSAKLNNRIETILSEELNVFLSFKKIKDRYRVTYLNFMKNVVEDIRNVVGK